MIKIESWIDPYNPYSLMAYLNLKAASQQLPSQDISYVFFESPNSRTTKTSQTLSDWLAEQSKQSAVWGQLLLEDFTQQAQQLGVVINPKDLMLPQDFQFGLYLKQAQLVGQADVFVEEVLTHIWLKGQSIDSDALGNILSDLAESDFFDTKLQAENLLKQDRELTESIGIHSDPFIIVNEEIGLEGIQPIDHLVEVLTVAQSGAC